jgi:hypothetical protein
MCACSVAAGSVAAVLRVVALKIVTSSSGDLKPVAVFF